MKTDAEVRADYEKFVAEMKVKFPGITDEKINECLWECMVERANEEPELMPFLVRGMNKALGSNYDPDSVEIKPVNQCDPDRVVGLIGKIPK